jgi:hypothetical protein
LLRVATSLGGVESLVSLPFNTSHSFLTDRQRREVGIEPASYGSRRASRTPPTSSPTSITP